MPAQTREATTFAREYQHILFGNQDWSMPIPPHETMSLPGVT